MLKFENVTIELNFDSLEIAKTKERPIFIDDENYVDSGIELSLDQAKWLRDNINYIIKKFE